MSKQTNAQTAQRDALILETAKRQFFIETLETHKRDRLNFHDVPVWTMRAALADAFETGRASAGKR